ncbi:hypothetical protein Cgig2_028006 [Carnegiea gigantea]|uniref:Uncharacterized protein n=1 Tax=Carnegiea gigantea TaxID=171969 RepID=A0A9Q1GZ19_9CARY|nr:hypothetical protein Cgig2_028006 [Carnegiea gigantea]
MPSENRKKKRLVINTFPSSPPAWPSSNSNANWSGSTMVMIEEASLLYLHLVRYKRKANGDHRAARTPIDMDVIAYREVLTNDPHLPAQCLQLIGFSEANFPLEYLGVSITASKLTKVECQSLVEKILSRVHIWNTRHFSFAGRAKLINSVIFGMFNYWASIFMLPTNVPKRKTCCESNGYTVDTYEVKHGGNTPLNHIAAGTGRRYASSRSSSKKDAKPLSNGHGKTTRLIRLLMANGKATEGALGKALFVRQLKRMNIISFSPEHMLKKSGKGPKHGGTSLKAQPLKICLPHYFQSKAHRRKHKSPMQFLH